LQTRRTREGVQRRASPTIIGLLPAERVERRGGKKKKEGTMTGKKEETENVEPGSNGRSLKKKATRSVEM